MLPVLTPKIVTLGKLNMSWGNIDTVSKYPQSQQLSEGSVYTQWFVHWLAIHRASPVPIYAIWLYTGLDRTYYSFVFL